MRWSMAAAVAAGVLAGCGVGTSGPAPRPPRGYTAPTATATVPATATTTRTVPAAPAGGCSLTDPVFHAGGALDCRRRGADVHLVHEHDVLATGTTLARLLAVNTAPEITGRSRVFEPRGVYVRVTLVLTNLTRRAQAVRPGQTALIVGGRQVAEVVALEDGQDARSLLSRAGPDRPLARGASVTGEAVYDVPLKLAPLVPKGAWVAVAGFGPRRGRDRRVQVGGIALGA